MLGEIYREAVVASYEEKIVTLTRDVDAFKKELIAKQEQIRIAEIELTTSKEEVVKLVDKVSEMTDGDMHTQEDVNRAVDQKVAEELQKFWDETDANDAKEAAKASDTADEYDAKIVAAICKYVDKQLRWSANLSSKAT